MSLNKIDHPINQSTNRSILLFFCKGKTSFHVDRIDKCVLYYYTNVGIALQCKIDWDITRNCTSHSRRCKLFYSIDIIFIIAIFLSQVQTVYILYYGNNYKARAIVQIQPVGEMRRQMIQRVWQYPPFVAVDSFFLLGIFTKPTKSRLIREQTRANVLSITNLGKEGVRTFVCQLDRKWRLRSSVCFIERQINAPIKTRIAYVHLVIEAQQYNMHAKSFIICLNKGRRVNFPRLNIDFGHLKLNS